MLHPWRECDESTGATQARVGLIPPHRFARGEGIGQDRGRDELIQMRGDA
jgi:hypothetical protein